jgi:hypothetical protein
MKLLLFIILSLVVFASCKPAIKEVDRGLLEKELTKGFTDVLSNFLGQGKKMLFLISKSI